MSRIAGKPSVLVEGSDALRELIETYATMDIKAFCAKWGLSIATVRSTASRRGLLRERKKATKIVTANTNTDKQRRPRKSAPVVPPPPPVPAYEPPKDLVPPNVLKHVPGRKVRSWKKTNQPRGIKHDACTLSLQRNHRRTLQPRRVG